MEVQLTGIDATALDTGGKDAISSVAIHSGISTFNEIIFDNRK